MNNYVVLNTYEQFQMLNMYAPIDYQTRLNYLIIDCNGGVFKQFVKALLLRPLLKFLYWINARRLRDQRPVCVKSYQFYPMYGPMVWSKNCRVIHFYSRLNDNFLKPFLSFAEFVGNW